MPCSDGGPCYQDDPETIQKLRNTKARLDWVTRAACDMRTVLRRNNLERELTTESRGWIVEHDAEDARRVEAETKAKIRQATKRRALAKLSDEERVLLGLDGSDKARKMLKAGALDKLNLDERRSLGL
jgi:hypothetical protein